jgi:hypothetical protein
MYTECIFISVLIAGVKYEYINVKSKDLCQICASVKIIFHIWRMLVKMCVLLRFIDNFLEIWMEKTTFKNLPKRLPLQLA